MYRFINTIQKIFRFDLLNFYYKYKKNSHSSNDDVFSRFDADEKYESYEHFKKYFYTSIFIPDEKIREYAIKKSLELIKENKISKDTYFLEFGVHKGISINYFSKYVDKIYGFDSFKGLSEDWLGFYRAKGAYNLNGKAPYLRKNVEIHVGLVQDTLEPFLDEHIPHISFVHMDLDTYPSSKFVLEKIKPYLFKDSIILFDQLYNYSGWKNGEHKAVEEVFKSDEFEYLAFSSNGKRVCIKLI